MRRLLTTALLGTALTVLPACTGGSGSSSSGNGHDKAAQVVTVPGTRDQAVELNADAARRIEITTVPVALRQPAPGQPAQSAVPLDAVIYDKVGRTWVYTNARPRFYVRTPVQLGTVVGDFVVLRTGPAPGTRVVTVGAVELLGVEQGVGGEQ